MACTPPPTKQLTALLRSSLLSPALSSLTYAPSPATLGPAASARTSGQAAFRGRHGDARGRPDGGQEARDVGRPLRRASSTVAAASASISPSGAAADPESAPAPESTGQKAQGPGAGGKKETQGNGSPGGKAGKGGGKGGSKGGDVSGKIAQRSANFSRWYLDVIREAQLADYGPVRGTMVIRPYGYAIWEAIQSWLDRRFKETGHQNMYFPQFIPYSFIEKEASHVEGFSPELALVTIGGGKELEERLVVRPTSETIVNHMFAQWIQSYRDLPVLINQWANVTRWEMSTRPFVRTLEFLWQEGHTAHATEEEAEEEALRMVEVYREFAWNEAALPVVVGRKSRNETFAGAVRTYTIEAMMGDAKALQAGTSHMLGQNFARAFGTQFLSEAGKQQHVWQTSWGVSTRMVGAVIMGHGDDAGLQLPPRLAPIQVVVVPIWKTEEEKETTLAAAVEVEASLKAAGIRSSLDASEQQTPGWKFNHWEMKGVPVRIEIGPRDVASRTVVTARRDRAGKAGKEFGVSMEGDALCQHVSALLQSVQDSLLASALSFRDSHILDVGSYEELKAAVAAGKWARGFWEGSDENEKSIKEETGATLRCFPFEQPASPGVCFFTQKPAKEVAIFARSY